MVKLVQPWLRSLLRNAKKQQRTTARAVKTLLAVPKVKSKNAAAPAVRKTRSKTVSGAPAGGGLAGQWLSGHYTGLGAHGVLRTMQYWLYMPPAVPPQGIPLVIMLHGCDQNANAFAQGTRMNLIAEKQGYAVVYPQQSKASHPQACWKWYDRATQEGGGDVGLIVGIVNTVTASHPIDRSRIYICGFSAGGAMAHIVALNHPGLIAAVGVHSSPLFGAARGAVAAVKVMLHGDARRAGPAILEVLDRQPGFPAMPTILLHGESDRVVRPVNQSHLEQQALLLNRVPAGTTVDITSRERTSRTFAYRLRDIRLQRKLLLRVVQISELKHAWSGGDDSLVFNSGPGPVSSKLLLDFFSRHRRAGSA
ncbi:alpha/beta hydrolase family esterase [Massilia sp. GCM10020059]|uniref:PHB depolymerase family esterase n=1 Tax=Massilia agrisoli TaxID=2892444 RepID=A0ABS8IT75_9BURK|nr:PHB depolymerase family esterase [Massilia agrisoli]MCC6071378.1 PHB depolymerase family esterase [Massilia agrisoli]